MLERVGMAVMRQMDPERAHGVALMALKAGLGPRPGPITTPRLRCTFAGLDLPNPVGLAAGFDKNATAFGPLMRAGFGFLEVGAATPKPQPGNPKPRLFRLTEDCAAINRFGFNNDGMKAICARMSATPHDIAVGLNLGANKDSDDRAGDFAKVLEHCAEAIDFATVNVSSPNTERLRDLQGKHALKALLEGVIAVRDDRCPTVPIFLKIAPDLTQSEIADIVEVALEVKISAIIATNTTQDRQGLRSIHRGETGGLSGAPLFDMSTRVVAWISHLTDGKLPIIGVGGIASADQAYAKIRAGASAVQLYTAMVFGGLSLAADIARGLDQILERDGFANVADAVGTGRDDWL